MSEGLNRVMLLGNLGADPQLRYTQGGTAVLTIRMATTETYFDQNKVKKEKTEWHSATLFGKRAESLSKFIAKGSRVFVEGGLHTSSWEDNQGNKRYKTEVNISRIIMLDGKRDGSSTQQQTEGGVESDVQHDALGVDDIPF
jgi:single-strand DNA-binding protein